ncbi:hypothetical protein [Sphingosinicella terrae]|uniref:hypothetical protein n=1 Tax=Sphingosinicella terrae TaxID=2172047 RepID=UPI000E0DE9C1|nr:hypothetical protein [Sphingosinicella terrae]
MSEARRAPAPADTASSEAAEARVQVGGFVAEARATMTPQGLLAIGGLVGAILLSVAVLVRAARR